MNWHNETISSILAVHFFLATSLPESCNSSESAQKSQPRVNAYTGQERLTDIQVLIHCNSLNQLILVPVIHQQNVCNAKKNTWPKTKVLHRERTRKKDCPSKGLYVAAWSSGFKIDKIFLWNLKLVVIFPPNVPELHLCMAAVNTETYTIL